MKIFQNGWPVSRVRQSIPSGTTVQTEPPVNAWVNLARAGLCLLVLAICPYFAPSAQAQTSPAFGCTPAMANDIVCENSKTGNPSSDWDIPTQDAGDPTIQGFASDISVAQGGTISFKVKSTASAYRLDIYRMGYYNGNGARLISSINPSASLPQSQPPCDTDATTKLYDCGNWAVSASWTVPTNATSGIYFVHLVRPDTGGSSHIVFIVRNDSSHSAMLFQTSDEAWQAYNDWGGSAGVLGGNTLYGGPGANNWDYTNRAYKVSYNRPFDTRSFEAESWVFNSEYPMVRFLEANGYDVTYFTHVDGARSAGLIENHKTLIATGHDEYWSGPLRANVESARDAGVNLAFFTGNESFWKTRWENSIDGSSTAYRTLVCYKESLPEDQIDPEDPPTWTGTWRDPTFSPPSDGGRPENALTGTLFMVNGPGPDNLGLSIKVPAADGAMRFWRNTSEATLGVGATATLPAGTLGPEWDIDPDNGFRPAGTFDLSTATYTLTEDYLLDYGATFGAGVATHHLTLHRAPSGALVFGAGTIQWPWGLDSNHDNTEGFTAGGTSTDMMQATINLFADMSVQPASIQGGLLLATQSTDITPPVSTITSPISGADLSLSSSTTISGTASDSGGGVVGGVEVSVDGGQTWHPATGRGSWSYSYTPQVAGVVIIMSRATDDSGNIETPGAGVTIVAGPTHSISGFITPSAAGNNATVKVSGSMSATVTASHSGIFSISGLASGNYTVTPSQSGYSFSPLSSAVTITTSNISGVHFSGTLSSATTYSISGSVTPASEGAGVLMTLTGAANATTITDGSGNFAFTGLPSGTYTLTPTKSFLSFYPAQSAFTVAGNMTGISFTAPASAQTLFTTQTPVTTGQSDGASSFYELGTQFQSSVPGQITAIRFWKDVNESGTHTGNIWTNTGTLLTSVTFTGETESGWQVQPLSSPFSIAAGTTYVVSVNTPNTYYVATEGGLTSSVINGDLSSIVGNNGLFGPAGTFPTSSFMATNYFRDIYFAPNVPNSLTSVTLNPTSVNGGNTTTGTVTLAYTVPMGQTEVVSLSASNPLAQPHTIQPVTNQAALQADGSIAWSNVGPPFFNSVASGYVAQVSGVTGLTATITNNLNLPLQFDYECPADNCIWSGDFSPGADVLWDGGAVLGGNWTGAGPMTVAFSSPQRGFGVQVEPDEPGPFTATICAFDSSNNPLGCSSVSGNGTDNPAHFIGIYDDTQEIAKVTVDAGGALYPHDFAIGDAYVVNAAKHLANLPTTVSVPAGSATATFTVTTNQVSSSTSLSITGNDNGVQSATLTLTPPVLYSILMNANSVVGGTSSTGTVTLSQPAPSGGALITLTNDVPVTQPHTIQSVGLPGALKAGNSITPSALQPDGMISWSTLGPPFYTNPASGFTVPVSGIPGLNVTIANSLNLPLQYDLECPAYDCIWSGNFNPGADVLWDGGAVIGGNWTGAGPMTVTFNSPQRGLGFQISPDELGSFTATMCAYDSSNTQLGCASFNGAGSFNNQSIPIGIYDDTQEIAKVTVDAGGALYPHDFAIGDMFVTSAARPVFAVVPTSITVPAGLTTATFTVTTNALNTNTFVNITGSYSGTQTVGTLQVRSH